MEKIFDTHAHYDSRQFDEDRDEVLCSLPERGVCAVINCATTTEDSLRSIAIAEKYPYIYAAVGVHPEEALSWDSTSQARLRELAAHPRVVAIGEIGLDYFHDNAPHELQREIFRRQLELAAELRLPVIIHDREAHGDMYDILREYAPVCGVMHCFSGDVMLMRESVRYGLYIGLGGAVTFKNARKPVESAAEVPEDRFLLETDAPYMAPVPYRGKRNDSTLIAATAERVAEIRGTTAEEVIRQARENAYRLFGIGESV